MASTAKGSAAAASSSSSGSGAPASASTSSNAFTIQSRLKEPYLSAPCPYTDCRQSLEYLPPTPEALREKVPAHQNSFSVTCAKCRRNFEPPGAPGKVREARAGKKSAGGGAGGAGASGNKRRIGTDERPLDTS